MLFFTVFALVGPADWLWAVPVAMAELVIVVLIARWLHATRGQRGSLRDAAKGAIAIGLFPTICLLVLVAALLVAASL
ncbi:MULTISPECIES: hypothetical protein [unclassified Curtobacterium]|uniref:hypothetical protein n=1 Tax=unclassified Curtobacterium TaxID=257496 RepID=UPI001FB79B23|nr:MULTISPECIES: hypothetical protein [unclassified Curtobacterium]